MRSSKRLAEFKIYEVSVTLNSKKASVMLLNSEGGSISAHMFFFDPPKDTPEDALREMALAEAKRLLQAASDFL